LFLLIDIFGVQLNELPHKLLTFNSSSLFYCQNNLRALLASLFLHFDFSFDHRHQEGNNIQKCIDLWQIFFHFFLQKKLLPPSFHRENDLFIFSEFLR